MLIGFSAVLFVHTCLNVFECEGNGSHKHESLSIVYLIILFLWKKLLLFKRKFGGLYAILVYQRREFTRLGNDFKNS